MAAFPLSTLALSPEEPSVLTSELLSVLKSENPLPCVALISLDGKPEFDELYQKTLTALQAKCSVVEFYTPGAAADFINQASNLKAIVATDIGLAPNRHVGLAFAVRVFVKYGGTLVFCAQSNHYKPRPTVLNRYFQTWWDLPWEYSLTVKDELRLNKNFVGRELKDLPRVMKPKVRALERVAGADRVYNCLLDRALCPVALGKFGGGFVGWVGDKICEEESLDVLIAMCGLEAYEEWKSCH